MGASEWACEARGNTGRDWHSMRVWGRRSSSRQVKTLQRKRPLGGQGCGLRADPYNENLSDLLRVKLTSGPGSSLWKLIIFSIISTPKKRFSFLKGENRPFKDVLRILCGITAYSYYSFNQDVSTLGGISSNVACPDIFANQCFASLVKWKEQILLKFIFYFLSLLKLLLYLAEIRYWKGPNMMKEFLQFSLPTSFNESVNYLCQISKMRSGTRQCWSITTIYFTDIGVSSFL